MTEKSISRERLATTFGSILTLFLMHGCSSVSPPERQQPNAATPEVRLLARTDVGPAAPRPEESPGDAQQPAIADIDEERSVFFALGSTTIPPKEKVKLERIAISLKADKSASVTLSGHANDNGSRSFNLAVADARVEAVVSFLKKQGVSSRQITKLVFGGEKTPRSCRSTECRQRMRRVEIILSPSETERSNDVTK